MESDEKKPEVQPAKRLVVHSSGHFRKPIVEGSKEREENRPYDDIVKVRDDEVRIRKLPVEWRRGQHDSCQAGDQKLKQKGDTKQHRSLELDLSAPHGGEPVEDFDSGWN